MVRVDFVSCPCCSGVVVTVDEDCAGHIAHIGCTLDKALLDHLPSGRESVMAGSDPKKQCC